MGENALVECTYQALMGVVQTTAVSRKVLARPPFTFLHKLLVETLGEYHLFSPQQLQFSTMTTKQAKIAFLTRAIAFVTFAISAHSDGLRISCILLVSPVQVLAGVNVSDTLEFLLQLCEVCRIPDHDIKVAAAKEVREKGDAYLYSLGVTFRKGIVLIQRIIRTFLNCRAQQAPVRLCSGRELSMTEGTRFFKELADGRIYNGIIRSVQKNTFVLGYDEDAEAEDRVSEMEMKIILEKSRRLSAARKCHRSMQPDDDILLTNLPDLTGYINSHAHGYIKRASSTDSKKFPLVAKTSNSRMLKRAQSQRESITGIELFSPPSKGTDSSRECTNQIAVPSNDEPLEVRGDAGDNQDKLQQRIPKPTNWQNSLKKMLANGRDTLHSSSQIGGEQQLEVDQQNALEAHDRDTAHLPNFRKLGIPGTTKSPAALIKRALTGPVPLGESRATQKNQKVTPTNASSLSPASRVSALQRGRSSLSTQRSSLNLTNASALSVASSSNSVLDTAFAGTYQTTDQRTQETLALVRDVAMRIDGYMKRKRLRVIDLFRFCDTDGNGSISPGEMIETLSLMEIQLTPDQAREFLQYIDKDGNGSIDVDEFDELVRVARRDGLRREQLKKELNGSRKSAEGKASLKYNRIMTAKTKQRILDEFKAALEEDSDGMNAGQLRALLERLALPGISDTFVSSLVNSTVEIATEAPSVSLMQTSFPSPSSGQLKAKSSIGMISYHHLAKALNKPSWTKKSNRFLDQSWMRQFDSQLDRAIREYELL